MKLSKILIGRMTCVLGILFVICTAICIPCIVYGCNSSYTQCLKWDFKDVTVVKVGAQQNEGLACNKWITINSIITCTSYRTYIYYTSTIYFDTCVFQDSSAFDTSSTATIYGRMTYPPGNIFEMIVSRDNPSVCEQPGGLVKNLDIVGFVFGPLAAIFAVGFICTYLLYVCKKEIDTLPRVVSGGVARHRRAVVLV